MLRKIHKNKKGVLGLELARSVIVTLLILAVTAIAVFLALVSIGDINLFTTTASATNETGAWLNATTYTVANAGANDFAGLTITQAFNDTSGAIIGLGNFTVSGTGFTNATATVWNNVSVSYSYSLTSSTGDQTDAVIGNITTGTVAFFEFTPTWMILLAVAVLIAIIAIVIFAVTRLEGREVPSGGL